MNLLNFYKHSKSDQFLTIRHSHSPHHLVTFHFQFIHLILFHWSKKLKLPVKITMSKNKISIFIIPVFEFP